MNSIYDTGVRQKTLLELCLTPTVGLLVGLITRSVGWGIVGAALGYIIALVIGAKVWKIWICGPRWDELRNALENFETYSVNDDRFYMMVGERKFNLYREEFSDQSYVLGFELPWKYWRDRIQNNGLREKLQQNTSVSIKEGTNGLYVPTSAGSEGLISLFCCLLQDLNVGLQDLRFIISFRSGAAFDGRTGKGTIVKGSPGIQK